MKRFYRCRTCGDIHWGINTPNICPTCDAKDDYVEIDRLEVMNILGTY